MGSDWQYIQDHMGGHDEDGMPNFMRSNESKNNICYGH